MTYEEAKMQIQAIPEKIWDQLSEPDREAMEMAFSALQAQEAKTQLSAEGTTSDLISRQEAIDVCDNAIDLWHGQLGEGIVIAVKKKIEELLPAQPEIEERKEESAQNVPKEDLISRKAAIDSLDSFILDETTNLQGDSVREILESLPSAQPERKKGKWIKLDMHAHLADHKCTACGQECYVPTCMGEPMYTYCPNCGSYNGGENDQSK